MRDRTIVYIDGLNFYYGAVRGTQYKWLNFEVLCQRMVPNDELLAIRYFTAKVGDLPHAPGASNRQQALLDAMSTLDLVEITLGHFAVREEWRPIAPPPIQTRPPLTTELRLSVEHELAGHSEHPRVKILKAEEKRSDVSLGALLVADAYSGTIDRALVITNDADLVTPIRLAKDRCVTVDVINPGDRKRASSHLRDVASSQSQLDKSHLPASQFPDTVVLSDGREIHKPDGW